MIETISTRAARRLALVRAGLLKSPGSEPAATAGRGAAGLRRAVHDTIDRFGYLQLDTVSVAGARSHALVLMSRLDRATPELAESLLRPGEPLFEYWGHEVSWIPMSLYPTFGWRRRLFRQHPWWGDVIGAHPDLARDIMRRVREEGPLKSSDLEGPAGQGWWNHKPAKNVTVALWSAGDLIVRERRAFQRTFDLPERVIPAEWREAPEPPEGPAVQALLLRALAGHGWAQSGTLAQTWRLRRMKPAVDRAIRELAGAGGIVPCDLSIGAGRRVKGWIRPGDLELAARLEKSRPSPARPRLLSPFDPLLWDRARVSRFFGFEMRIEIFTPAARRSYGYYCLPVLAGERLVARVDLKADRRAGALRVLSCHPEPPAGSGPTRAEAGAWARQAVERYAGQIGLPAQWRR